jgi:hypothetical protein
MSAAAALVAHLAANAGVSALVGDRIYSQERPQGGTLPAIVYEQQFDEMDYSHNGDTGYIVHEFELTAWAATKLVADQIGAAVRAAISGFRGTLGAGASTITAGAVFITSMGRDEFDDDPAVRGSSMVIEIHQQGG